MRIALAGNPNSGKTTLFNAITGSKQYVGNWPGVTVEKKEGRLVADETVTITDLPGIYSLSPYTMEEVVARDYLLNDSPDGIINIVDGSNLQRNLFLTSQIIDMDIPTVVAINMADVMEKEGYALDYDKLSEDLGVPVVSISAAKEEGIDKLISQVKAVIERNQRPKSTSFSEPMEETIGKIKGIIGNQDHTRFLALKAFEGDESSLSKLGLKKNQALEELVSDLERRLDEDRESILTQERYDYIDKLTKDSYWKKDTKAQTISEKIDNLVLNKFLALPIFMLIIFLVYYISVSTVGTNATDFVNEGIFGEGFFALGMGRGAYEENLESYNISQEILRFYDPDQGGVQTIKYYNEEDKAEEEYLARPQDYDNAVLSQEPNPEDYGRWVSSLPVLLDGAFERIGLDGFLSSLILDGIVAGVGAVLGFLPQMFVLFLCLAILEGSGYMSRIAFILDRIFRGFGLSGKSFIPMMVGTGCTVPGVMAARTIQSDKDRQMTIITTPFIPCSAKLPVIALIAGAIFKGAWWVAPSAYFLGIGSVLISATILKKIRIFEGDPTPFVMELPDYRLPGPKYVLRSAFDRSKSFVKKAGTIVLLSTMIIWFTSNYGFEGLRLVNVDMDMSILAKLGKSLAWIFAPLGWGTWENAVATISGLVAKENVVSAFAILYSVGEVGESGYQIWNQVSSNFTSLSAYSFLAFNLLSAPCFAAIGAMRSELGSRKMTVFALSYLSLYAYMVSLMIYQFGKFFVYGEFGYGTLVSLGLLLVLAYLLLRPGSNDERGLKHAESTNE